MNFFNKKLFCVQKKLKKSINFYFYLYIRPFIFSKFFQIYGRSISYTCVRLWKNEGKYTFFFTFSALIFFFYKFFLFSVLIYVTNIYIIQIYIFPFSNHSLLWWIKYKKREKHTTTTRTIGAFFYYI